MLSSQAESELIAHCLISELTWLPNKTCGCDRPSVSSGTAKGGVGKTTAAIHLAAFLQAQGETLPIDADPNRSATG
ncbi:ParA family protein [Thermoleptolyngbya sichuanensis A183]|uniref:ParA family protein n=1 Tax=Thermoleptolyngbya sichuanensis A183 TaxID=2737172 RepID=A0A6M8B4A1_9CYAN|nr:ParA family protein [Thermoleptolyngbya sichuanensis A183]